LELSSSFFIVTMTRTYLCLEDGEIIEGESFGFPGETCGEVVFTTAMTGYPETLTDPSFAGQILVFTYPLLGNYGIPKPQTISKHLLSNFESEKIHVQGVVVSSHLKTPSHYQIFQSFSSWLAANRIPGIARVDTRKLTQKIREHGVLRGSISRKKKFLWREKILTNLVSRVSLPGIYEYTASKPTGKRILLIDCGVKHGILRALLRSGYDILRIPWNADPHDFFSNVDGVVCSNGPGDPKDCKETIKNIQTILQERKPFLGICLGHQLVALALGADTYKLSYGHRGLNQPCQNVEDKRAYVTSQNHGYAVKPETLPKGTLPWFINLNDHTNEGIINREKRILSTQFHPEGSPGPFDTEWIFTEFIK